MPEPPLDAHDEAMRELLAHPDVIRVELGLKEVGGEPVRRWAYRAHVREKRPLEELSEDERLPTEIGDVAVDVIASSEHPPQPLSCTDSVEPGDKIQRFLPNESQSGGTVCALVRKGSNRFILTNQHVIRDDYRQTEAETLEVYVPEHGSCNDAAGRVQPNFGKKDVLTFDGHRYDIDATLVPMNAGIEGSNSHSGIGGAISTQLHDLRPFADAEDTGGQPPHVPVTKRGQRTGVTTGQVVAYRTLTQVDGQEVRTRELRIAPSPGVEYTDRFEFVPSDTLPLSRLQSLVTSAGGICEDLGATQDGRHRVRITARVFSREGDSGSPILTAGRRLAGILHAGSGEFVDYWEDDRKQFKWIEFGPTTAAYIHPTFTAMGLDFANGIIPAGSGSAGPAVAVPGAPVLRADGLDDLREELAGTPARDLLRALSARHLRDVFRLIHDRRRVMLVWHRSKSKAFLAALLIALRTPGTPLPPEIDGVPVRRALTAMRDVLCAEGSPGLRGDLDRHGDWLIGLAERCAAAPDARAALLEATA